MENKFTPGPWLINKFKTKVFWKPKEKWMPGHIVAYIGEVPMDREERDANANLIAAAPDLLKALQILTETAEGYHTQLFGSLALEQINQCKTIDIHPIIAAQNAINKALNK